MAIRLLFAGQPPIELFDEHITLGSDPSCTVKIPESAHVSPNHAVIRLVDGRWIIEACDGEPFFVGGAGQKKAHWLTSGNVIRFSDEGPFFKIELSDDVSPASEVELVRRSPRQAPKSEVSLRVNDEPLVRPSDVVLLPESDSAISTSDAPLKLADDRAPLSASNIDSPKRSKSGGDSADQLPPPTTTIRTSKAPTSTTIPTRNPPSSTTIRTSRSASGEIPAGKATRAPSGETSTSKAAKSSRTDGNIPTKAARRSGSSAQIPATSVDPNEPPAGVPVLKRLSSWEAPAAKDEDGDELLSIGEPIGRRHRNHDADVEWIKMVILRCAGVGLIVLLVWLCIHELRKVMSPVHSPSTPTVSKVLEIERHCARDTARDMFG